MSSGIRAHTKFSPNTPHFYKIILEENLGDKKLQIPQKFVAKYGDSLSSQVFLKLPSGLGWKVGLTKSDGKVWMDEGWKKFANYCSLGCGNLLVFRYNGNSKFHIIILDTSTTEIDYPPKHNHFEKHGIDRQSHEFVKEETEVLDSFSPCHKTRDISPLPCDQPLKKMKTDPSVKFDLSDTEGEHKSMPPRWMKPKDFSRKQRLRGKRKAEAHKRASGFKSEEPFFTVIMQSSFVGDRFNMNLPSSFARKYLCCKHADVILKVPDGRTWSVKYSFREYNGSLRAKFDCGWKAFAQDNDLKLGDVCDFVLTKSDRILFEVAIFCENGVANSTVLPECEMEYGNTSNTITGVARPYERASSFQSGKPFFTVAMCALYANGQSYFLLPYKFVERSIDKTECEVRLWVSDGRSWSVHLAVRHRTRSGSPTAEFCRGWKEFALDNSLEEGDICTFLLTNKNDISFRVSIVKAADDAYNHLDKSKKLISEESKGGQVIERPSSSGISRASEAASRFFSSNPYFQVAMRSGHMAKCVLHVPSTFAKSYLEEKEQPQTMTLWVGERSWPVTLLTYPTGSRFSAGWAAFARENSLQPRDICIFELTKRNELGLKVSIFKQSGLPQA